MILRKARNTLNEPAEPNRNAGRWRAEPVPIPGTTRTYRCSAGSSISVVGDDANILRNAGWLSATGATVIGSGATSGRPANALIGQAYKRHHRWSDCRLRGPQGRLAASLHRRLRLSSGRPQCRSNTHLICLSQNRVRLLDLQPRRPSAREKDCEPLSPPTAPTPSSRRSPTCSLSTSRAGRRATDYLAGD